MENSHTSFRLTVNRLATTTSVALTNVGSSSSLVPQRHREAAIVQVGVVEGVELESRLAGELSGVTPRPGVHHPVHVDVAEVTPVRTPEPVPAIVETDARYNFGDLACTMCSDNVVCGYILSLGKVSE